MTFSRFTAEDIFPFFFNFSALLQLALILLVAFNMKLAEYHLGVLIFYASRQRAQNLIPLHMSETL
jgi:hypothetical protein